MGAYGRSSEAVRRRQEVRSPSQRRPSAAHRPRSLTAGERRPPRAAPRHGPARRARPARPGPAGLDEAAALDTPNERYATAHLAALRTAAAVLAARGRPETSERRGRAIRSAWEVLPEIAPELTEWSALFASGAARRARAEAGIRARPAGVTPTT